MLNPAYLLTVFLVFVRIGGVMVAAPFFSHGAIPVRMRVLLAVLLAYVMAMLVPGPLPAHISSPFALLAAVGVEALTGLVLVFAAQFIFLAVQFAGEIAGFQMSLSMAQVYNPVEGHASNPLGRFLTLTFLLVFLLIDGHHHLLRALAASFRAVPLAGANLAAAGPLLLAWTGDFFTAALRLAAPFVVTLFLIDLVLGVFARVVPQADLFSLSLPLKLAVGLGLAVFFMQNFFPIVPDLVARMLDDLLRLVEALA